ncbi:hypothetical protein FNU79_09140 [Deinococcus detaillensis]|uniref:Uncharacterized protein n=1 Tax=Deinococcus detaillensis TaxID=2592048 RepID=A0A553V0E1_9DEIO|nr:hypothetical protein [Deinococcus detaillensis]TSA85928.1 hypothetical protein FNU79_09140 [Deinococcus detaillensis]
MVQVALDSFWSLFSGWHSLFWLVLLVALFGALTLLTLRLRDRPNYLLSTTWLREVGTPVGAWAAALLLLAFTFAALDVLGSLVVSRVSVGQNARAGNGADLDAAPTTQDSPTITYLTQSTYTRTLIVPPSLLKRVGEQGVGALAPYLTDPTSENVIKLVDKFRRSGQDVIFTRQATLTTESPIKLDTSRVKVNLDFVTPARGAKRTYYNATFAAEYAFTNPLDRPVFARFQFPLPNGSGTLSGFKVLVDGKELTAADLSSGSRWQAQIQPKQTVKVQVTYAHQGARGWSYLLASRREPIKDFELSVKTNEAAKFARYSLPPTQTARSLGGSTLTWNLKDVITAQDVSMTFSSASLRETLSKLYSFAPLALLLAVLFGALWAWLRGLRTTPAQVALASLAVLVGLTFGGVLMSYLPMVWAGLLGSVVATMLALRAIGTAFWPPVLIATALPLAFLLVGNAGLVIILAGVLALGALIWGRTGRLALAKPIR